MPVPSRRLFLLRHAQADTPPATQDHERPLSTRGCDDAAAMGAYMVRAGLEPSFAVVSTATRTRSTWALVQKALPRVVPAIFESRIYQSSADDILSVVRSTPAAHGSLIVVGHNPGMHKLALHLVGRADRNAFARLHADFPPGSLAVLDFDVADWGSLAQHSGSLERFATPASQPE